MLSVACYCQEFLFSYS